MFVSKLNQSTQAVYNRWVQFLEQEVQFNFAESSWHTKDHCARVLHFALLIAQEMRLSAHDMKILAMASVFHDTRREDDGFDIGHGARAAVYYREYCASSCLEYCPWTAEIMSYHDQPDELGESRMTDEHEVLLYRIFKDADALDRFRLGPDGLDVKYLRTEQAKSFYDYARDLWYHYSQSVN